MSNCIKLSYNINPNDSTKSYLFDFKDQLLPTQNNLQTFHFNPTLLYPRSLEVSCADKDT